ncbi:hypothetical protein [Rubritalea tangerina]|uniref:hypothetical protein n=1 Tax=Rubritalea tangerina TaxID=430798 RepID=UPI003621A451
MVKSCDFALRDFRVYRIILPNIIVVIQLSRACGTPSLRLDILQAHSDHSSIPFRSMVLGRKQSWCFSFAVGWAEVCRPPTHRCECV